MNPFLPVPPTDNRDRLTGISILNLAANAIVRRLLSWRAEAKRILAVLSLALIGNAAGQTFGAERDIDPRRFR
jgi:hypothetical protein